MPIFDEETQVCKCTKDFWSKTYTFFIYEQIHNGRKFRPEFQDVYKQVKLTNNYI